MNANLASVPSSKTPSAREKTPLEPIKFLEGSKELQNFPYDLRKQLEAYCRRHHRRDLYGATKNTSSGDLYSTKDGRKARFIHPERHDEELLAARYSYGTSAIITVVQQKNGNDLNDGRPAVIYSGGGGGKQMLWENKWSQAFRFTIWDVAERGYNGFDFVFRQVDYSDKFKDPILKGPRSKRNAEDANGSPQRESLLRRDHTTGESKSTKSYATPSASNTPRSARNLHKQPTSNKESVREDSDTIVLNQSTPKDGNGLARSDLTTKGDVKSNPESNQNGSNAGNKRRRSISVEEARVQNDALQKLSDLLPSSKRPKNNHHDSKERSIAEAGSHQDMPLAAEAPNNSLAPQANFKAYTERACTAQLLLGEEPVRLDAMHSQHQTTVTRDKNACEGHQMTVSVLPERTRRNDEAIDFIMKMSIDDDVPYRRSIKQGDNLKSLFTIARITKRANPAKPLWIIVDNPETPIPITQNDGELLQDILDAFKFVGKSEITILTSFENNITKAL